MGYDVLAFASTSGGFGGGRYSPSFSSGGLDFSFKWVYDVFEKIVSVFSFLFDVMFKPMYTWLDDSLSFFGLSDAFVENASSFFSNLKFFQLSLFEYLTDAIPIVICLLVFLWAFRAFNDLLGSSLFG